MSSSEDVSASVLKPETDTGNLESQPPTQDGKLAHPGDSLSGVRYFVFVATVCTSMFNNQLAFGNTLGTVNVIGASFGVSNPGQLSWLIAGYSLTTGTFILIGGRLGDEFGNKGMLVLGTVWSALWSMIAGLSVYSKTHVLFIFARVFQGMGPALTLPNALAILGKAFSSPAKRNMAFAWFGGTAPLGAVTGFVFGGIFAKLVWWPWIYWSHAIAMIFVAAFAEFIIPTMPMAAAPRRTPKERLIDLDIPGGLTGVAALVLFNFAWNQAVVVTWREPYVYVCLILGILFAVAFFYIETYRATKPLLPIASFNSNIAFVFACTATGWGCFGIWVFYVSQVALNIGGKSPLGLSAWFVPVVPVGIVSSLTVGKVVGKVPASWIMVCGQAAFTVGSILSALRPPHSIYWTYYFCGVSIITVGMDTSFPAAAMIFSSAVPPEVQGMGASIVMTVVNYSISLALGFAGTIEININNGGHTVEDRLRGYRGALWFSVGLAGLGLFLSLVFAAKHHLRSKTRAKEGVS